MTRAQKTALGNTIDMDRLRLTNEYEQAVGNMHVNARGDEIDPQGNIVRTRNEIMREHYNSKNQQKEIE